MIVRRNDWKGAFNFLLQNPQVLGVRAPAGTGPAGYALLHTCLAKQTPDWFMDHIFHRTPLSICVGAHRACG